MMPGCRTVSAYTGPAARYSRCVRHYDYPEDEFDAIDDDGPVPVGAHRAEVPAWRSWVPLLLVILIVPLLAWGAVALLGKTRTPTVAEPPPAPPATAEPSAAPGGEETTSPEETEAPEATAGSADLTAGVTVHNGTMTNGLAGRTGDKLQNAGFTGVVVSQGSYQAEEPRVSTVFYSSPEFEATARTVAEALGITEIVESPTDAESNPVVVVLRDDYQE